MHDLSLTYIFIIDFITHHDNYMKSDAILGSSMITFHQSIICLSLSLYARTYSDLTKGQLLTSNEFVKCSIVFLILDLSFESS